MQFRLSTLFLLFVVLWSSLAVFGGWGIFVFIILVIGAMSIVRPLWFLPFFAFLLLIALLLPAVARARAFAYRLMCESNVKCIAMALHNYHQVNGCFPPAYIADKNGKPMHSWRVLILPYLEGDALYKQYNFNEPWDGPNNKQLLAARPRIYACSCDRSAYMQHATCTSYVAVVGSNAVWPGKEPGRIPKILSETIMLVETSDDHIPWTEPRDLDLDSLRAASPGCVTASSKHFPDDEFFFKTLPPESTWRWPMGACVSCLAVCSPPTSFPKCSKSAGFESNTGRQIGRMSGVASTGPTVPLSPSGWRRSGC